MDDRTLPVVTEQSIRNAGKAAKAGAARRTPWKHPSLPSARIEILLARMDETNREVQDLLRRLARSP
ncbi:MAG: hypothetical protein V3S82_10310 [Dehalococcoidia bacterium]